jgi:chaperonin GroES
MAKSPMGIKPLHDYVLVVPAKQEEKTASGIILPDAAKEKPQMGEVVAVGPGAYDEHGEKRMPMEVKVGDCVLYKKWGSEEIKMDREEMMLIKQSDIMAIVS